MNNRLKLISNPHQSSRKKVLCVCSIGYLRSPTAAIVLANELGFNTRSCGVDLDHALIPVDEVLLAWADEIVCFELSHVLALDELLEKHKIAQKIINLNIPDDYDYMDAELIAAIKLNYISHETAQVMPVWSE